MPVSLQKALAEWGSRPVPSIAGTHRGAAAFTSGRRMLLVIALSLAFVPDALLNAAAETVTAEQLDCGLEPGPARAVAEVIDGDTLRLDDGKVVKLAGILAPRAFDAGAPRDAWPPELAAKAALNAVVAGRTVSLAFTGARTDRYERVIAHLFAELDGGHIWVQRELVATGHARVHAAPGASACLDRLVPVEAQARGAAAGLWSNAAYQLRHADRPSELQRYAGTYQLVTGTVARVTGSQALVILELASSEPAPIEGSGRRAARTRIVWKRNAANFREQLDTRRLNGAQVLVRGWIENRGHPEIELLVPEQIEVGDVVGGNEAPTAHQSRSRSRGTAPPSEKRD